MIITVKTNFPDVRKKLDEARAAIKESVPPTLAREGRGAAISMAKSTVPYGTGADAKAMGEKAVARDIRKIYATPSTVYGNIVSIGGSVEIADAFYEFIQAGKIKRAQGILKKYGGYLADLPIEKFNPAYHKELRSPRTGRVPQGQRFVTIVSNPEALLRYITAEKKLVGFGKSAWAGAARALGGIRGLRAPALSGGATDGAPDITANWITRQRAPFSIHSSDTALVIASEVTYADRTLRPGAKAEAVRIARERIAKQAVIAGRYELRRALGHNQ